MSILQLPNELIADIIHRLSTYDLSEVLYCHSKFYKNFNWNKYFHCHFGINVKLTNDDVKKYNQCFINDLNNYFFYNIKDVEGLTQSDIDCYDRQFEIAKNNVISKLVIIDKFAQQHRNHLVYNNEITFLSCNDFDDDYFASKDIIHIRLTRKLGKFLVITQNDCLDNASKKEILDAVENFKIEHGNEILILML